MINRIPVILILFSSVVLFWAWTSVSGTEKQNIYRSLQSDDIEMIDKELLQLSKNPAKGTESYEGALRMKKAGLLSKPQQKLQEFKQGRTLLENAIKNEPSNAEYAFLRLIIQENAPAMLGYNSNIRSDAALVKRQFKTFEPVMQRIIKDYSLKRSKVLNASELQ